MAGRARDISSESSKLRVMGSWASARRHAPCGGPASALKQGALAGARHAITGSKQSKPAGFASCDDDHGSPFRVPLPSLLPRRGAWQLHNPQARPARQLIMTYHIAHLGLSPQKLDDRPSGAWRDTAFARSCDADAKLFRDKTEEQERRGEDRIRETPRQVGGRWSVWRRVRPVVTRREETGSEQYIAKNDVGGNMLDQGDRCRTDGQ